ncbi:MAG: type II secretion system protein [Verrucomicrobiales bacterium]|nr:type II secretion system protein [Verrucomicrobiales bacterium]
MQFKPTTKGRRFNLSLSASLKSKAVASSLAAGFTLIEVLAALAFLAIVIPVAVEGLRVANLAGQVGQRKAAAGRIAERVMNELFVTGQLRSTTSRGIVQEGTQRYEWSMSSQAWPIDAMRVVTVQVTFPVQGRDYEVRLSTLLEGSN